MAGFLSMTNLGRIAKVIALLLFVLPWVTVSCADQTLVTMSGVDLATGHVSLAANPLGGSAAVNAPAHGGDVFVIFGAVLILVGLVIGFVLKGARGAMAAAACAAIAGGLLAYTVFVRIKNQAVADSNASAGDSSGFNPQQLADMIHVNVQIGFYLCLAALIAAVAFDLLSTKAAAAPVEPPA